MVEGVDLALLCLQAFAMDRLFGFGEVEIELAGAGVAEGFEFIELGLKFGLGAFVEGVARLGEFGGERVDGGGE